MGGSIVKKKQRPLWVRYGIALFAVASAVSLLAAFHHWGVASLPYFTFYAAVIFVALYAGFGPGLLAVGLSTLAALFWVGPGGEPAAFSAAQVSIVMMFVLINLLIVWSFKQMRRSVCSEAKSELSRQRAEATIAGQEKTIAGQVEAVHTAEARLAFALEAGRIGVWDLEVPTQGSWHSPQDHLIIGYEAPLSQWTYQMFLDHVLEEDRSEVEENLRRIMETGEDWSLECRVRRADGELRWVWIHGKHSAEGPPRILGLVEDITDRKRIEEVMRDNEIRYRTIFETAVDAIIIIDEKGTVAEANPATEAIFGYQVSEIRGQNLKILMPFPYHEQHDGYLENYRRPGVEKIIGIGREVMARHKDGSTFPIRLAVSEMRIGGQRMFTGQVHDISVRKRAEEALKEAIEVAEAANKAKDKFLAILSHELRTPLTPALLTASACETDMTLPSQHREQMGTIRRNLELEARMIDDLLDLNRLARGKIELCLQPRDLHLALRNVVEICHSEIEAKSLTIRLELTAAEYKISADIGRLQQVFWNLVRNAAKFTPTGGSITICSSNPSPGIVRVEVADTGRGIAAGIIDKIFAPFEQGEAEITKRFGGMGLGLAISKAVVDLHEGKIWAESEGPGKGATFTVELPFAHFEASEEGGARPTVFVTDWSSKIGGRKLRILLVEDNADTLQTMGRLLERNGCVVTPAGTMGAALEAAQVAREGEEKFDLVVSDLGLPDGDGQDLMRELHERDGLSGIAISGYGMEEDIEESRAAGFSEHLVKPIQFEALHAAISDLVGNLP